MSRYNEALQAVLNELKSFGVPYRIEDGSKHIRVHYEISGKSFQCIAGRSLNVSWRNVRNALADVRGHLRQAGVLLTKEKPYGEFEMSDVSCLNEGSIEVIGGVPRMRDIDIGRALGFTRPDNVRNLIRSNLEELKRYGQVSFSPKQTTERGGRPSESYLLNKDQSLLVAIFSRTAEAANVRENMIRVFNDYENQKMKTSKEHVAIGVTPALEPEILLNEPAIAAIAKAVSESLHPGGGTGGHPPETKYLTEDRFREFMEQMLKWQQAQFLQLRGIQDGPRAITNDSDAEFIRKIETTTDRIMSDFKKQMSSTTDMLNRIIESQNSKGSVVTEAPVVEDIDPVLEDEEIVAREPKKDESEYLLINEIYRMAGIDPRLISKRHSLSMRMRHAIEKYSISKGMPPVKINVNGLSRNKYHKDALEGFYKAKGRRLLSRYLIA